MTADKRSVATDALEVLGLPDMGGKDVERDAIHLAVEPAVAGVTLRPGESIVMAPDGAWWPAGNWKRMAIVDPFLSDAVPVGGRFLAIVPPREITSLRHVWSHPDFPAAEGGFSVPLSEKCISEKWIAEFAAKIDQTPSRLMSAADAWLLSKRDGGWGEYTYDNTEAYKQHWDQFPEFWRHYEIVTGVTVEEAHRQSFFTCSC